tara:strand:- start:23750 stop:24241 length:492 start_codon:yes stop_codon:yes gene_type:complete
MHIRLKNNFIYFYNYKIKCSIGKRGLTSKKREGDLKTPKGKFTFRFLLYRKDRIGKIQCKLTKKTIKSRMGWCDDPNSRFYNRLIYFPFKKSAERLFLKKNIYDLILVLNYNIRPVIKNRGSAIFLHIANKNFSPTKGCIAIQKKNLIKILRLIDKKTKIFIS